jgi:hypothetical protein
MLLLQNSRSSACISRSVVPMYISSIISGDDLMSRLKVSAWKQFESRLTNALEAGAVGGKVLVGWQPRDCLLKSPVSLPRICHHFRSVSH